MIPQYITSDFGNPQSIIKSTLSAVVHTNTMSLPVDLRHIEEDASAKWYMDPVRVMYRDLLGTSPNQRFLRERTALSESVASGRDKPVFNDSPHDVYIRYIGGSSASPSLSMSVVKIKPMTWLINTYNIKTVLDPFARWGERLLACMVANVSYTGCNSHKPSDPYYTKMINGFRPQKKTRVLSISFDDFVIDQVYDMMYFYLPSMPAEDTSVNRCLSVISKLWSNLPEGKMLVVHSNIRTQFMVSDIKTYITTQQGKTPTVYLLNDNGELGSTILTWKKPITVSVAIKAISIKDKIFNTTKPLLSLGVSAFIRRMKASMHYIADKNDTVYTSIVASLHPNTTLTVHLPQTAKSQSMARSSERGGVGSNMIIETYSESFETEYDIAKIKYSSDMLIPTNLATAVFEADLITAIRNNLPTVDGEVVRPTRIWIRESHPVVIRALVQIWKTTIFLVIIDDHTVTSSFYNEIPLYEHRRIIIFTLETIDAKKVKSKDIITQMRKNHGLITDHIMLSTTH